MSLLLWTIIYIVIWTLAAGTVLYVGVTNRFGERERSFNTYETFLVLFVSGALSAPMAFFIILFWDIFLISITFAFFCIGVSILIKKIEASHVARKMDASTNPEQGPPQEESV